MSENSKNARSYSWVCVIYPESLPKDFEKIIQLSGLKCALSPLHDKDLNADEEHKKPHYHLIYRFDTNVRYSQAKKFSDELNGTIPQLLHNVRGYYRYFTHKDNPEKYQYYEKDIKVFNGFDIRDYCTPTSAEISQMKIEVIKYIRENKIYEYADLLENLLDNELIDLFDCASSNTILFNNFLHSKRIIKERKELIIKTEIL